MVPSRRTTGYASVTDHEMTGPREHETQAVPAAEARPPAQTARPESRPEMQDRPSSEVRPQPGPQPKQIARTALRSGLSVILVAGLTAGLLSFGLFGAPTYGIGIAAYAADQPPQRPPIVPPMVPEGAREDWATWTYVDKISQAWGKDWPLVIQWFEELDARYPGNPMVLDKLYVAYIEDGRRLQATGDFNGARYRFEQAQQFDPARGIAQELLDELDTLEDAAG